MERVLSSEVERYIGKEILLKGWVHQIRKLGKITFVILRDRRGTVQLIADSSVDLSGVVKEAVVEVEGIPKLEPQAPGGREVKIKSIKVMESPREPIPFEVNRSLKKLNLKLDMLLNHRAFSLRNPEIGRVFRIQAEIIRSFADFMRGEDFLEVHTPKIVASGTEGGTALFPVQYFEKKAYLAQSPQFYKQMLVGAGYERVFEIGFVYRAEDHATSRHLNEYLSLDFEMGFIDSVEDVMRLEERLLRSIFENLKKRCKDELSFYKVELPKIEKIPRVRFSEVKEILKGKELRDDLDPEAERLLCEHLNSDFVFVTHFPASSRPFYTMPSEDPKFTESFDLLYKGMEVTTGSQRIHNYDMLCKNIRKFGMDPREFEFYLEIFKYGMPPHGGLAIGAERLTQKILGLKNIREACLFPRDRFRLIP